MKRNNFKRSLTVTFEVKYSGNYWNNRLKTLQTCFMGNEGKATDFFTNFLKYKHGDLHDVSQMIKFQKV